MDDSDDGDDLSSPYEEPEYTDAVTPPEERL